jgi:hypothetical protein
VRVSFDGRVVLRDGFGNGVGVGQRYLVVGGVGDFFDVVGHENVILLVMSRTQSGTVVLTGKVTVVLNVKFA